MTKYAAVSISIISGASTIRATVTQVTSQSDKAVATIEGPPGWVIAGVRAFLDYYVQIPGQDT